MGIYIIIGIFLLVISFLSTIIAKAPINLKSILFIAIYTIGGVIAISGENAVITSVYIMGLTIMSMYSGTRQMVNKVWEDKGVDNKIDNFADKLIAKNKRLAKENARKEKLNESNN